MTDDPIPDQRAGSGAPSLSGRPKVPALGSWLKAWAGPSLLAAAFLLFAGILLWMFHSEQSRRQEQDLASSALSARESFQLRLRGNEDYLQLLAAERARGTLSAAEFQRRISHYVAAHPELINVTWVDASFVIRDVAPLGPNQQIVGLTLDLPEPKRAARLARERRLPIYTRPFEAIQGRASFEVWVPVFRGEEFLGLFAGVYTCPTLLQEAVPATLAQRYHFQLRDGAGGVLGDIPPSADLAPQLDKEIELTPPGQGVTLRLEAYGSWHSGSLLLELLCAALTVGMVYSLLALNSDVRRRQQYEEKLRTSEERWKFALDGAGDGVWDWDIPTGRMLFSRRYQEMLGHAKGGLDSHMTAWTTRIHPDSRALVMASCEDCLSGRTASFSVEYRMKRKDGSWIWVLGRGKVVSRDAAGKPLRMIGTLTDITERKEDEDALRLAAQVYQHSSEAMSVTDADNKIIAVNAAFTRMTGYEAHEALGQSPRLLQSGHHDPAFYQAMWQAIEATGHWQGEITDRRKNGEVFTVWLSINTIHGEDGSPHRRVALFSDITEKKRSADLIWRQANFDPLTHLPNRNMFHERLEHEIRRVQRDGRSLAVFFIDLDQFKEINDALGHDMGDHLLVQAARRIRQCVRESDTVARMGGDEFTVILSNLDDPDCTGRIAQSIVDSLAAPFPLGDEKAFVSASIGITFYPADAMGIEDLLKHADQAMYAAKTSGRNRFNYYTPALTDAVQKRMRLTNDLRDAVDARQFKLYYQPIVELATGRIFKAEALIRWEHPRRGPVSPAEFIPLAEASGTIVEIGEWVFRQAVGQVKRWRSMYHPGFQVTVNTSPVQFRHEAGINQAFRACLQELEVPGEGVAIEITEGLLLDAASHVTEMLLAFRAQGIQVALDDFGTGYSSLSYLQKFAIDYLKIDQAFVRNLGADAADRSLCEAIIVMAHKLGLKVVAEGVETPAQRDLLAAAGCDFVQGYLISRPLPPEEFEALLAGEACKA